MSTNSGKNDEPIGDGTPKTLRVHIKVDLITGELLGENVQRLHRAIKDMKGIFRDEKARQALSQETVVYRVQAIYPVGEGQEGGLFWGTTFLEPGVVGDEYFMTKGHFHAKRNRGEYYMTISGHGALILMDRSRRTTFEPMHPGSLYYIPDYTAHRVANTGDSVLAFMACWPSDAGHDYATVARDGFSARLRKVGGVPTLLEEG